MFPSKENDELWFSIPSVPCQRHTSQQDPIMDNPSLEISNFTTNTAGKRRQKLVAIPEDDDGKTNDNKNKIIHKEIERKRRQEMATLHASLRSLLPLEQIKGKRSISDHIQESVKYIKHLEKNLKELGIKKDKLDRMMPTSSVVSTPSASSGNCLRHNVTVIPCGGAVDILMISGGFREETFPLSRVLRALLEEGLDVVSYVSTQVNDRFLHTIKSEVSDPTCVNLSVLEQKLTDMIN